MDLDQLRAENAAQEASRAAPPQDAPDEEIVNAAEGQEDDTQDADLDGSDESTQADAEDWMKGDEPESQGAEKKFTDNDVAAAKKKLRAKLEAKDSEVDELRKQLEQIKNQQHQAPQVGAKPTREQFYEQDDPDAAYTDAVARWTYNNEAAQQQAQRQKLERERAAIEHVQAIEASVDKHYERAAKLTEQSGISPDLYRSADERVRTAIDQVFPGEGEAVTNILIDLVGEGSERVMYHLGVNTARRAELQDIMRNDPKGLKAAAYLGKLAAELTAPAKRKSNAPAPAAQIQGDATPNDNGSKLLRQYKEAHAKGNTQAAFDLKWQAKQAGINTKTW